MPKCVKCLNYFHPDFCIETEIRNEYVTTCLFCYFDKKELTVEDNNGRIDEIIKKDDAIKNYKKFLEKLVKKPKIRKLIINEE